MTFVTTTTQVLFVSVTSPVCKCYLLYDINYSILFVIITSHVCMNYLPYNKYSRFGKERILACMSAASAAFSTSSSVDINFPYLTLYRMVSLNRTVSCGTTPTDCRSDSCCICCTINTMLLHGSVSCVLNRRNSARIQVLKYNLKDF